MWGSESCGYEVLCGLGPLGVGRSFMGTCRLHLQSGRRNQCEAWGLLATFFLVAWLIIRPRSGVGMFFRKVRKERNSVISQSIYGILLWFYNCILLSSQPVIYFALTLNFQIKIQSLNARATKVIYFFLFLLHSHVVWRLSVDCSGISRKTFGWAVGRPGSVIC
jgi:hypothetical protein